MASLFFLIFNRTFVVAFATPDKFESKHKQSLPNKCQGKLNIARTPPIPTFSCVKSHKMTLEVLAASKRIGSFKRNCYVYLPKDVCTPQPPRVSSYPKCIACSSSANVLLTLIGSVLLSLLQSPKIWWKECQLGSSEHIFFIKQKQILFEPFCVGLSQTSLKFASACLCLYEWAILGCKKRPHRKHWSLPKMGCLFSAEAIVAAKILNATLSRKDVIMLQGILFSVTSEVMITRCFSLYYCSY
jgi:hypothetical protein